MRYYIRQQRKHVSGPFDLERLKAWVRDGKVREEMEFSEDGETWMLGVEMIELFGDRRERRAARPRRPRRRRLWGRSS